MVNDVSRAFLYAPVYTDIYVELCDEARTEEGDQTKCAKLKKGMYGTQPASHSWQRRVKEVMKEIEIVGRQGELQGEARGPSRSGRGYSVGTPLLRLHPWGGRGQSGR